MKRGPGDGSAGDADYGAIGKDYSAYRQADSRIAAYIDRALKEARTVLNVGAGAGSYEPRNREVTAVEPSASMRAQRPPYLVGALDAAAEHLPFPHGHFDASMATFTVHQWTNVGAGLREMRRVTRGPVLVLTCDPELVQGFWLNEYAPHVLATEARRYPSLPKIAGLLGGNVTVEEVPIPLFCTDGFNEAYYGRPERLLEDGARLACSAWSFVDRSTSEKYVAHLRHDISYGEWDRRYGELRKQPEYYGSLRMIAAQPLQA